MHHMFGEIALFAFKSFLLLTLVSMSLMLAITVFAGRIARRQGYPADVELHKYYAKSIVWLTWIFIAEVVVLEIAVHWGDYPLAKLTGLFCVHLIAAVTYLITLHIMVYSLTGLRTGTVHLHRRLAYFLLLPSFSIMTFTGLILFWRM